MALLQCDICGGKLMAKSGGIFECEYCGMQYDKTRIQEMVQEIKGTVKVEGTVQVAGTVKVDGPVKVEGSASKESLLKRAQLVLEDRDWKSAAEYFGKVLDIDPECAESYFGLAMCETEANTLEALVNAEKWDNKNYIKGKRFASPALLAQVEQLEQAYLQRKWEEAEKEFGSELFYDALEHRDDFDPETPPPSPEYARAVRTINALIDDGAEDDDKRDIANSVYRYRLSQMFNKLLDEIVQQDAEAQKAYGTSDEEADNEE